MSDAVLDASVVIAYLNNEPGQTVVTEVLQDGAVMSAVNVAEVAAWLADGGMTEDAVERTMNGIDLEVVPFSATAAIQAGLLRPLTRHAGLSLGDRACLALARQLSLPVLTADRNWQDVNLDVEVRLIR